MKKTMIVANWKMHLNTQQASLLVHQLDKQIKIHRDMEVVLAPSLLTLQPISMQIDRRKFKLASQDAFAIDEGAYTGAVSFTMLRDLVHYAIIGHSERRIHFHESLEVVRDKVSAAVRNEIVPILCVGETRHEHAMGEAKRVVHDQVVSALLNLTPEEVEHVVIAYEPVWAIGTGTPEKPDSIAKMIAWIRRTVAELYGQRIAGEIRILYGASVEPDFVKSIISVDGVDGLLVGGASLHPQKFADIVNTAYAVTHGPEGNG
jgi:triosephosphate isomerase